MKGLLTWRAAAMWDEKVEIVAVLAAGTVTIRVSPPE